MSDAAHHHRRRFDAQAAPPHQIYDTARDAVAVAVLMLCDGSRTVEHIAAELAQSYSAPRETILADFTAMLQGLAEKGVVTA
jgi:hypothetical protein